MSTVIEGFAAQSGHFYAKDGSPAYEVIGKNGKQRPTTVRDAKALNLYPSVTTICKLLDKPGLTNWLIDQAILAALTLPRQEGEDEASWLKRVKQDAKEQGRKAAERGTAIHAAIERLYQRQFVAEWADHAAGAVECVEKATGFGLDGWDAEKSATSHEYGYGCKTDLIRKGWTIDFKSKEFGEDANLSTYDEQHIQVQANSVAHGMPENRGAIVYVSATIPGLSRFIEIDRADLDKGFSMFQALIDLWQAKHDYKP